MRQPRDLFTWDTGDLQGAKLTIADLHLNVVTPMFGGSERPRESDARHPVRAASVRGQLRFWWRACNASDSTLGTLADLFDKEARLWGAAAAKERPDHGNAAIEIEVFTLNRGSLDFYSHTSRTLKFDRRGWHHGMADDPSGTIPRGPNLALFPFQETQNRDKGGTQDAAVGRERVEFQLRISLAPHVKETRHIEEAIDAVEQAVWAWIAFGGVGSRGRRGCGTLWCADNATEGRYDLGAEVFQPDAGDLPGWFAGKFERLVRTGAGNRLVSSLHGAVIHRGVEQHHAIRAWKIAVDQMHEFRQGEGTGRNPRTQSRPGQSRWPEPGAIRELRDLKVYGADEGGHTYRRTAGADGRDFPRADLGLPILFQNMEGAHDTPTLQGAAAKATRLSSPIILKALPIAANRFVPMALLLNAPHVWDAGTPGVKLSGVDGPLHVSAMNAPVPHWPFSHHPPRTTGKISARDAFMDFLEKDRHWTSLV